MSRNKRSGRSPKISGSPEWIASGSLMMLFGGLFLALAATSGSGPGISPQGWFIFVFGLPVGAVVLVIGLVKRHREGRRRDRG